MTTYDPALTCFWLLHHSRIIHFVMIYIHLLSMLSKNKGIWNEHHVYCIMWCVSKNVNPSKFAHCFHILRWIFMALGQKNTGIEAYKQPSKNGVKGHFGVIRGYWPQLVKICTISHCIHILWWTFMELG